MFNVYMQPYGYDRYVLNTYTSDLKSKSLLPAYFALQITITM